MENWTRIYGLILRQLYLFRRSPTRVVMHAFWPTIMMLIWGFMNKFLAEQTSIMQFAMSTLLGASLLNSFFERSNVNVMFAFLEDVWARNVGNVLISPIKPLEMIAGYVLNGTISVLLSVSIACLLCFLIFDYSILIMGLPLISFIVNLVISGWCIGLLLIALILRFGPSGESFGWMVAFAFTPLVAIYYPVSILPGWLQHVSWALPPTYVFESLREYVMHQSFNMDYFYKALGLNAVYLGLGIWTFLYQLKKARQRGGLFALSE